MAEQHHNGRRFAAVVHLPEKHSASIEDVEEGVVQIAILTPHILTALDFPHAEARELADLLVEVSQWLDERGT